MYGSARSSEVVGGKCWVVPSRALQVQPHLPRLAAERRRTRLTGDQTSTMSTSCSRFNAHVASPQRQGEATRKRTRQLSVHTTTRTTMQHTTITPEVAVGTSNFHSLASRYALAFATLGTAAARILRGGTALQLDRVSTVWREQFVELGSGWCVSGVVLVGAATWCGARSGQFAGQVNIHCVRVHSSRVG